MKFTVLKEERNYMISIDATKLFNKVKHVFMLKNLLN